MIKKLSCGKTVKEEIISSDLEEKLKQYMIIGSIALGIKIKDEQLNQFLVYLKMIISNQGKINLSAIKDPFEIIDKHFLDSISCFRMISDVIAKFDEKEKIHIIDIGTGAGFPGLPIKIILPKERITLLEAKKNKKLFLDQVVTTLGLRNVKVIQDRAENIGRMENDRENYHIVLSRAVASLGILCEYCLPLCRDRGVMIAFKGSSYKKEIDLNYNVIKELGGYLEGIQLIKIPRSNYKRSILIIRKVGLTPDRFPRRIGIPKKRPLYF